MADIESSQGNVWIDIQKRTFTRWCNSHLVDYMLKIESLETDLQDGIMLCTLLESISGKQVTNGINKKPKIRVQKLENNQTALRFLQAEGIKLVAIGPEDITDGFLKLILGLIWTIILRYQIQKGDQGAGGSAKNDLLQWVRSKIPEYDIKNFKNDWNSGKALCALVNALNPGTLDLSDMGSKSNLDNATTGTEGAEKHLGIPPVIDPNDLVSPDVDELSVMTYISYFRDYENNKKNDEALSQIPDAKKCQAYGPGLERADVGYETDFTVQMVNSKGHNIPYGSETVEVQIKGPVGSPAVTPELIHNGDGTTKVKYTPKAQGNHVITVTVGGKPLARSPFNVTADRLGTDATQTTAQGPGVEGGIPAGSPTHFTITSKNKHGDPVGAGGETFDVKISGPHGSEPRAEIKDNRDGTYTVQYKPLDKGDYKIEVHHKDKDGQHVPIQNSPYHINVDPNPEAADAANTRAYGPGLEGATTGSPADFTIEAFNNRNEPVGKGGDAYDVEVVDPHGNAVPAKVKDHGNGKYTATYQPEVEGPHKVNVVLRKPHAPSVFEHVANSPITVNAEPGVDPNKSTVTGPGVEGGVKDTQPTHFTIAAKDKQGNPVPSDADAFDVKITDPHGNEIHPTKKTNPDGTVDVHYAPTGPGKHTVEVHDKKGRPVGHTPVIVDVSEGASHENTFVEGYSFTIRTQTKTKKDKKDGGETFSVQVVHRGGDNKDGDAENTDIKITDKGDGTYGVSYALKAPGKYTVHVKLNDHHILGSPWKQTV